MDSDSKNGTIMGDFEKWGPGLPGFATIDSGIFCSYRPMCVIFSTLEVSHIMRYISLLTYLLTYVYCYVLSCLY